MSFQQKRAIKQMRGLLISWDDPEPLNWSPSGIDGTVSHKNPVYRLVARQIWSVARRWAVNGQRLSWLIKVAVVFNYPNGRQQLEEREIEGRATIDELNSIAMEQIDDAMRHGNKEFYVTTKFFIECLGC